MHDQMNASQALAELTTNIEAPETKPYLRGTLQAALINMEYPPAEISAALNNVYKPQVVQ